jgi:hypothetical protein
MRAVLKQSATASWLALNALDSICTVRMEALFGMQLQHDPQLLESPTFRHRYEYVVLLRDSSGHTCL